MAITTLLAIRSKGESSAGYSFQFIVSRRSRNVKHFPGVYCLPPGGLFASYSLNALDDWSINSNVFREFTEEIIGNEEMIDPQYSPEQNRNYQQLKHLVQSGKQAVSSATGFSIDLTGLVPEISTILVIDRKDFMNLCPMSETDEWERLNTRALDRNEVKQHLIAHGHEYVPTAALTLVRGLEWLEARDWL